MPKSKALIMREMRARRKAAGLVELGGSVTRSERKKVYAFLKGLRVKNEH